MWRFILKVIAIILTVAIWPAITCARDSGQKYALVIGIKGYPKFEEGKRLRFADKDAQRFADFIQTPAGGEFKRDNVRLLINEEASRANIFREINWLSRRVGGNDLLYIFFAGHGITDEITGQVFFMPYEADPNNPEGQGIRADHFIESIWNRITSKHKIVFIDACYAGAALNQSGAPRGSGNASAVIKEIWLKKISEQKGETRMGILSASSFQQSWEDSAVEHGVFSYHLIQGLKGGADTFPSDGSVTAGELYRYLLDKVEEHSKGKFAIQTPITTPGFNVSFPLAVYSSHPPNPPSPSHSQRLAKDINSISISNDQKKELYQVFLSTYLTNRSEAYVVAKQYLQKYGTDNDAVVTYLKKYVIAFDHVEQNESADRSGRNSGQQSKQQSAMKRPSHNGLKKKIKIRLTPVYRTGARTLQSVGMPVSVLTSAGRFIKRLSRPGFLQFDNVPCGEEVTIIISDVSYNGGMFAPTTYKRYINCDKSISDLGVLEVELF